MKEKNTKQTFKVLKIIFIFLILFSIPLIADCKVEQVEEKTTEPVNVQLPKISNPLGYLVDDELPSNQIQHPENIIINRIIMALLGVVGSLALIMFIYGGFTWILSGGNEENVKKGKQTLKWSTAGIIIIFASYAILNFVLTALEYTPSVTSP